MKFLIALALIGAATAVSVEPVKVVNIDAPAYEPVDTGMYIIPEAVIEELSKAGIKLSDHTNTVVVVDDVEEAAVKTAEFPVDPVNVVDIADVPIKIVELPVENEGFEKLAPGELEPISWIEFPADEQDAADKVIIVELPLDEQPEDVERLQAADLPGDLSVDQVEGVRVVDLPVDDRLRFPKQYDDPTWR